MKNCKEARDVTAPALLAGFAICNRRFLFPPPFGVLHKEKLEHRHKKNNTVIANMEDDCHASQLPWLFLTRH